MFSFTFLVSLSLSTLAFAAPPPSLHIPLPSQLVSSNPAVSSMYSTEPSSALLVSMSRSSPALRVPPEWSFSIGLEWDTFLPPADDHDRFLSYSATLGNGSDLPEWMFFDPDTHVFGGFTPEEPQALNIVVTASTSSGLTASDTFIFIIFSYDFYVYGLLLTRNVTAGQSFYIPLSDFQGVHLAAALDIFKHRNEKNSFDIELDLDTAALSWLSYDPKSRVLQGTAPNVSTSEELIISATITVYHHGLSLSVLSNFTLAVIPPAFSALVLPSILIYPGEVLSFSLLPYLNSVSAWTVSAALPKDACWLSFDPGRLSLNGSVPVNASGNVQVAFMAKDVDRGLQSSTQLTLQVAQHISAPHTTTRNRKELLIVLGIVLGITFLIAIIFTVVIISYRRLLSTSTIPCKPSLSRRQSLIHRFWVFLVKHVLPHKETVRAVAKKATPEFAFFGRLLKRSAQSSSPSKSTDSSSSPPSPKITIGGPIAALEDSSSLLSGFVDAKRTEDLVPVRTGDMKQTSSRHYHERLPNVVHTPISALSHIAVKGSLEDMNSLERTVIGDYSDGGETLADRKAQLLRKMKHVTKITISPSGRAIVTFGPPATIDKSLPPTPGSTGRPSAPTPNRASQIGPVSSLSSDPSTAVTCVVPSLESAEPIVVVSPLSNVESRPVPIPKPTFRRHLPPTPGSTRRPSTPTPIKATQIVSVSSLSSDPSAAVTCIVPSLESAEPIVVVSPLSNFRSRPVPIPKPNFRCHKSLRTTPLIFASGYDQACNANSPLLPVEPTVDALPLLPTLTHVPISPFSEPSTPPPALPLLAPPTTPVSYKRRAPFGESSQESMTSFIDEGSLPRLLTPLVSHIPQRMRSRTTRDGFLMTPRVARERARLETPLELPKDNFRLDEFSERVFSEVGIKEEEIDGELVSRERPLSEEYAGSMESDCGSVLSPSSTALSTRVCVVSYPPDTPFQFKVPLRGVARGDELLVFCAYNKYYQPPPWACFEGTSGTFRGVTPKLKSGKRLRVKLNVWNLATDEVVGMCEIRVMKTVVVVGQAC